MGLVCYVRSFVKLYKHIGLACINDLDILAVLLDKLAHFEGDVQVYCLFLALAVDCTRILASMSGVNYKNEPAVVVNGIDG